MDDWLYSSIVSDTVEKSISKIQKCVGLNKCLCICLKTSLSFRLKYLVCSFNWKYLSITSDYQKINRSFLKQILSKNVSNTANVFAIVNAQKKIALFVLLKAL